MSKYTYVIAEAGLNHNGSMDIAKQLIDVAYDANADAVKFQKRTISELAIKNYLDKEDNRFPSFGRTYGEIRSFLEFDISQYKELKKYSEEKNLDFIVTPFDVVSLNFLEDVGINKYKIASHGITNLELLNSIAKLNKKVILSTGMAEIEDIDIAVNIFTKYKQSDLSLLHCVSSYPSPNKECNLNLINFLKDRYNLPVGYSGHEIGFLPSLIAVGLGAEIIERHYTLDKNMEGFDHKMSLNPNELKEMILQIRNVDEICGTDKKFVTKKEKITKDKYHVSIVSSCKINKGEKITKKHITYKNPGTGIEPKNENLVLGKIAKYNIDHDILIQLDMLKNNE